MTIKQALAWATKILSRKKISSPAPDAEVLLAFVIKKPKEYLFAHPEKKLTNLKLKTYKLYINRRTRHEPVAYITHHKEFYGLDFYVDKNVLIPRPETEILVEEAINLYRKQKIDNRKQTTFIDIGTGSGAIIVSLTKKIFDCHPEALEGDNRIFFYATDTSSPALKIAQQNAERNNVANKIKFFQGDLLEPVLKNKSSILNLKSSIILANLPYLTTREWQNTPPEIKRYEPRQALDGGPDGLKYYRGLFKQLNDLCPSAQHPRLSVLLEIGYKQARTIKKLARKYLPEYEIEIKKDLAGFDRIAIIKLK